MKNRYERVIDNQYVIVEDGLLSNLEMGEGRMIPAIVIKSIRGENRLQELINVHKDTPPGDVIVNWGKPTNRLFRNDKIYLHIQFVQPVELVLQIEFKVKEHYSLIDAITQSRGLFLGLGEKGEKVSMKIQEGEMISLEVPDTGFDSKWNKMLNDNLRKKFKRQGVPKKQLKEAVKDHINHMREILSIRREIE